MADLLRRLLVKHEGLRLKPYLDTKQILTIGVGRNLVDTGISEEEAMELLDHDITKVTREALDAFPSWFPQLGEAREAVVLSMIFNMGIDRFRGFTRTIAALEASNFATAADEMTDSEWAKEVGARAIELAGIMRSGADGSGQ